ncbi:putative flavin carrier protein precursor [Podospora australis]|uniref:Flavin carrier protein n=1 Tax=Podospora australis TaxID=1536484 RepID=A0AAN7AFB3_9PEZI|nr:putative flavin carrier protein precursor [Podospora australis]
MASQSWKSRVLRAGLAGVVLANGVLGADILQTVGFNNCDGKAAVSVQKAEIKYNNDDKTVTFDVAGTSTQIQNVTAVLNVTAYGQNIYSNAFDPCDAATFVDQLCPVPAGTFSARGTQKIPAEFASLVPSIAFQIPDIAAMATLQLESRESGEKIACLQAQVSNGKTASVPAVSYVAAGIAGAALIMTGISAAGAAFSGASAAASGATAGGMGTISPSFTEVFGWFQGMAMNGMMSVNYPNVYRSFSKNFGFSTGLVPWNSMLESIDSFREATGGNLTENSVQFLRNATLVFPDGSSTGPALAKRAFDQFVYLARRQIETNIDTTTPPPVEGGAPPTETIRVAVTGMQAYVQQLSIPSGDTFMTVLLIVAIVIAAIVVGVLLVKIILEFWALFGSFPKSLSGFRKHYWGSIGRAITHLILLLYGIWVLYCVFQFTHGDSWAAKTLAGITLFLFTGVLAFFSFKIWITARRLKNMEGDVAGLYEEKSIWVKYSLFYESYRKGCWWIFIPTIVYMFAKGFALAITDGNGMVQTSAQLIVEGVMLIVLVWSRPYERKSSNVVNITIQVVRVLSVVCIFVFVEQFGIAQTTQTVAGVVLIAVQSALTGILAILIAWNAISACCKKNPHRQRRKEMEKMQQRDTLTPLDARNSLLLDRSKTAGSDVSDSLSLLKTGAVVETKEVARPASPDRFANPILPTSNPVNHSRTPGSGDSFRSITGNNNSNYGRDNMAQPYDREPRLPSLGGDVYGNGTGGYNPRPAQPPSYGQTGGGGGYYNGYRQ